MLHTEVIQFGIDKRKAINSLTIQVSREPALGKSRIKRPVRPKQISLFFSKADSQIAAKKCPSLAN